MTDQFLAIPDRMVGSVIFPQEAVDWLAFGSPTRNARSGLPLDAQIACVHRAAGLLLLSLWGGDLPAYVHSPGGNQWFQIPALYWGKPTADEMKLAVERPQIPDLLPAQPRPLDPRYGIAVQVYPHNLPSKDLVGQPVAFRAADVERHCSIALPVMAWQARHRLGDSKPGADGKTLDASLEEEAEVSAVSRPLLSSARLREWIYAMNKEGKSQSYIVANVASSFPDHVVPGRPKVRAVDAEVRFELGLPERRRGAPSR